MSSLLGWKPIWQWDRGAPGSQDALTSTQGREGRSLIPRREWIIHRSSDWIFRCGVKIWIFNAIYMARISWTVWALLEPALYTGHHLTLVIKTPPTWIRPSPFVSKSWKTSLKSSTWSSVNPWVFSGMVARLLGSSCKVSGSLGSTGAGLERPTTGVWAAPVQPPTHTGTAFLCPPLKRSGWGL